MMMIMIIIFHSPHHHPLSKGKTTHCQIQSCSHVFCVCVCYFFGLGVATSSAIGRIEVWWAELTDVTGVGWRPNKGLDCAGPPTPPHPIAWAQYIHPSAWTESVSVADELPSRRRRFLTNLKNLKNKTVFFCLLFNNAHLQQRDFSHPSFSCSSLCCGSKHTKPWIFWKKPVSVSFSIFQVNLFPAIFLVCEKKKTVIFVYSVLFLCVLVPPFWMTHSKRRFWPIWKRNLIYFLNLNEFWFHVVFYFFSLFGRGVCEILRS